MLPSRRLRWGGQRAWWRGLAAGAGALALLLLTVRAPGQDRYDDGTPDAVRLARPADREAFRRWFTLIAEYQALRPPATLPREIDDCAALLRYSFRQALSRHDAAWARLTGIVPAVVPAELRQYHYPATELRGRLFRVRPGPFIAADLSNGAFASFADAGSLWRWNTYLVAREWRRRGPATCCFSGNSRATSPSIR